LRPRSSGGPKGSSGNLKSNIECDFFLARSSRNSSDYEEQLEARIFRSVNTYWDSFNRMVLDLYSGEEADEELEELDEE
jgi:hypothetical protein